MENLTDLELMWAKQFRTLCASIAGVKLFDNMWVEETPPIGTIALPWNAVSIDLQIIVIIPYLIAEKYGGLRVFFGEVFRSNTIPDNPILLIKKGKKKRG